MVVFNHVWKPRGEPVMQLNTCVPGWELFNFCALVQRPVRAMCAANYVGQTDQEQEVKWYPPSMGTRSWHKWIFFIFFFTAADVLKELGVI